MSTLEKLQAAAKAKLSAGQSLAATPVSNAPTAAVKTSPQLTATAPTTAAAKAPAAVAPTVKAPVATAAMSPQIQQEIQRKAAAGIALTNPTAASTAAYKAAQPAVAQIPAAAVKTAVQPTTAPTTAAAMSNTNYIANGGSALNEILYNKGIYNTSNKNYVANTVKPLYGQLDQKTAAMVKGMNYDQLRDYINGLGSQNTATTQNEGKVNEQYVDPYALTLEKIRAQAETEAKYKLDSLNSSYAATEKNIKGRYDYAQANTQDDRTLEDASFYRNNAPNAWDGSQGYRGAQKDRNRSIADTYTGMALQDSLAAAYAPVSDYSNNMGDLTNARINELTQQERGYNLNVADRTGYLNGLKTMQGKANDASTAGQILSNQSQQIANQISQIDLKNYPTTSQLAIQKLQQEVKSGSISNEAAQYKLKELTDPNSATNKAAELELYMKSIDASMYSDVKKAEYNQLLKTIAQIGAVKPTSDYEMKLQALDLEKAALQVEKLRSEGTAAPSNVAEEYAVNYIDKSVNRDEDGNITNLDAVKGQILSNPNLKDNEIAWLYQRYGIPLPQGYSGN